MLPLNMCSGLDCLNKISVIVSLVCSDLAAFAVGPIVSRTVVQLLTWDLSFDLL